MRIKRIIWLVGAMAIASAMMATTASALSVKTEATGAPCTTITPPISHGPGTGGCALSAVSTGKIEFGTALGMVLCNNVFEARVNGAGEGYLYNQSLTACSPAIVTNCPAEASFGINWPLEATSETNDELVFCVKVFGIQIDCHLPTVTVSQNASHTFTFTTGASHELCEGSSSNSLQGTWTSITDAAHPTVEIID